VPSPRWRRFEIRALGITDIRIANPSQRESVTYERLQPLFALHIGVVSSAVL